MKQFQVISACKIKDSVINRSEGFFDDEYLANSHADFLRVLYLGTCKYPFDVFVISYYIEL